MVNVLYYGDNLDYLKEMPSESADLIYLDPPFNSNASYNLTFRSKGNAVEAQTAAFEDTWSWLDSAERAFAEVLESGSGASGLLSALRASMGDTDLMAYLAIMTVRLIQMRRILKITGSIYLHCDPTASHYIKLIMDGIFGPQYFRNEIIWKRTSSHNDSKTWSRVSDTILFYTKSKDFTWNTPREPYSQDYLDAKYTHNDDDGRGLYQLDNMTSPSPRPNMTYEWLGFPPPANGWRYSPETMKKLHDDSRIWYPTGPNGQLDLTRRPRLKRYLKEMSGAVMGSVWTDIAPINSQAQERRGYPTQKPIALLERIILTSSNPGDVVLDPFCGCGTTVEAAERTGRAWIGIDITHHAIDVVEGRLKANHPASRYLVKGRPADHASALKLAKDLPYEFQWWANWKLGVQSYREQKKGADKGIDGIIHFYNVPHGAGQAIVSVKAGQNIGPDMIDALAGTVRGARAQMGIFVCAARPTEKMRQRAAGQGVFQIGQKTYPLIQIITAEDLVSGRLPNLPRAIETMALRDTLKPSKPVKGAKPSSQLNLALPISGSGSSADSKVYLSGSLLAELAKSA